MNNNDVTMNTSINIYNELLKMYNNSFNFNKSTIVEPFLIPTYPKHVKKFFIEIVIKANNYGYEINFTIDELENVLKNLESRAISLTFKQQEERKKVFINIKYILIKFKQSGNLDLLNADLLIDNSTRGPDFDYVDYEKSAADLIATDPVSYFNKRSNMRINVLALHALLLNVVDLFIEDIENISIKENLEKENIKLKNINKESENKINNNNIITIILVILLVIVIIFYIKK